MKPFKPKSASNQCPVCNSIDTCNDPDFPETMKNCNFCGSEWNIDGDIILDAKKLNI